MNPARGNDFYIAFARLFKKLKVPPDAVVLPCAHTVRFIWFYHFLLQSKVGMFEVEIKQRTKLIFALFNYPFYLFA